MPGMSIIIKPAPAAIAHGDSAKAIASSLSFLDLPGELRNRVYAHLFTFPDPLRICKDGSYRDPPRLYRLAGDRNKELQPTKIQPYQCLCHWPEYHDVDDESVDIETQPDDLVRTSLPEIGLFSTCRKVYYEATSVFYGTNTFTITHKDHNLRFRRKRHFGECIGLYENPDAGLHDIGSHYIAGGAEWLERLGSHTSMVRRLVIDLDNICPQDCTNNDNHCFLNTGFRDGLLDITSLLKVLWQCDSTLDVRFCCTEADPIDPDPLTLWPRIYHGQQYRGYWPSFECDAIALTEVLRGLIRDDLSIKKYGSLIAQVGIHRLGFGGVIMYKATETGHSRDCAPQKPPCSWEWGSKYHACTESYKCFEESEIGTGKDIRLIEHNRLSLEDLPCRLRDLIFESILAPTEGVRINVDRRNDLGPATGLLFTSQVIRRDWSSFFWRTNSFILECTSSEPLTSFSQFYGLRRWLSTGTSDEHPFTGFRTSCLNYDSPAGVQIDLQFDFMDYHPLEDLRISIMDFILATAHLNNQFSTFRNGDTFHGARAFRKDVEVRFVVRHRCWDSPNDVVEERTITLHDIRHQTLCALIKVVDEEPDLQNAPCPQIWMNGLGEIVEYGRQGSIDRHLVPDHDRGPLRDCTSNHKPKAEGSAHSPTVCDSKPGENVSSIDGENHSDVPCAGSTRSFLEYLRSCRQLGTTADLAAHIYFDP